jgi:Na+/proline symporter
MRFRLRTLLIVLALGPALLAAMYWAFVVNREAAGAITMLVSLAAMVIAPPLLLIVFVYRVTRQMRKERSAEHLRDRLREADQSESRK